MGKDTGSFDIINRRWLRIWVTPYPCSMGWMIDRPAPDALCVYLGKRTIIIDWRRY